MKVKMLIFGLGFLIWMSISLTAYGQTVSGTVTDAQTGDSLVGVNILVKGTSQGTVTNAEGKFSLDVPSLQDTLRFSYIGYETKMVPINGRTTVNISLQPKIISGQQLVVIGFGTQKRKDLSSSIATINPKEIQKNSVLPNAALALEGTTAGVSVTPRFGQPGTAVNIRIRGSNTFGNNNPLVIVDGTPGSLSNISSSDIASIQILKDAAAAAIYGTRAANGVVIVTTKKGQSGGLHINLKGFYGVQTPEKFISVANSEQYATILNKLRKSVGKKPFAPLSNPSSLGKGTDWQRTVYNAAPIWNTYLAVSGGGEHNTYRISGSLKKQKGILVHTWFRKALIHYKGQQSKGPITFGESISWGDFNQRHIPFGGDKPFTLQTVMAQPIISVYDSKNEGGFGGAPPYLGNPAFNPLGLVTLQHNTHHHNEFQGSIFGKIDIWKHFIYKLTAAYTVRNTYDYNYTPTYYFSNVRQNVRASLSENRGRSHHWLLQNTLHYKQQFGENSLNLLAGYTTQETHNRGLNARATGFPNNNLRVLNATTGFSTGVGGNDTRWDLVSIFGRILYNYSDRYYLTGNIRRDGSSRFGPGNRYGIFPSFSVAWRVSNESFFKPLKPVIDNLKFRVSYGELGNQPGGNYSYIPSIGFNPGLGYLFGNSNYISGAAIQTLANSEIQWETTKDFDVGVNIGLLNHINITVDYYLNKTDNLLLRVPIPPSTGAGAPVVNTGKVENQGLELSLKYNSPAYSNGFHFIVRGNISGVRNKVLRLGFTGQVIHGAAPHRASSGPITVAKKGYPIGAFFLRQADGLFQSQEEINQWVIKNGDLLQPNAQPGDVRYLDVNGDGKISNADVAYSGSPFPKFTYGINFNFNYKNLSLTLFLQGTYGNKMFDANTWITSRTTLSYNYSSDLLNAWTPNNTDTNIPRLTFDDPNHNSVPSTRFLSNASYLRIKTLRLSYNLPVSVIDVLGIPSLKIYVNAFNLATFTSYSGYDPSYTGDGLMNRGLDQGLYPIARSVAGGFELKF